MAPHAIDEFEQLYMVSEDERTDYPTFITVDGTIYFSFRDGGSGQGDQHFYRYDDESRQWSRVLDSPLIDETGASQIYNARFDGDKWMVVPATRWDFVWGESYSGTGALNIAGTVRMSGITPAGNGELTQMVWNRDVEEAVAEIETRRTCLFGVSVGPGAKNGSQAFAGRRTYCGLCVYLRYLRENTFFNSLISTITDS